MRLINCWMLLLCALFALPACASGVWNSNGRSRSSGSHAGHSHGNGAGEEVSAAAGLGILGASTYLQKRGKVPEYVHEGLELGEHISGVFGLFGALLRNVEEREVQEFVVAEIADAVGSWQQLRASNTFWQAQMGDVLVAVRPAEIQFTPDWRRAEVAVYRGLEVTHQIYWVDDLRRILAVERHSHSH